MLIAPYKYGLREKYMDARTHNQATSMADREIVIERTLDAPRKLVWEACTKPERIEFSHGGGRKGDPAAQFDATWTFEAVGAQTKVTIYMLFPTAADRDRVVNEYGAIEGGKQTLARLANYLTKI